MGMVTSVLDFLRSEIWGVSIVHWLMPALMVAGIVTFLVLFAKRNRIKMDTMCPVLKRMETLELDMNVFRNPAKCSGIDVTACTEFLDGKVTCGKECIHNPDVQAVYDEEKRKHQEDMRKGNTVIP